MTGISGSGSAILIDRCICKNRRFDDLLSEARERSWSLNELIRVTGCGGQCGLCRPYLRRMLATGETAFDHLLPPDPE
jgi:bacterioferritin-associated ferredoxin